MDNLIAVIPAAGAGKRLGLGINKAFAKINSVPLLVHCLSMLSRTKLITRAIVVLAPDEVEEGRELLTSYQGAHFADLPFVVVALGRYENIKITTPEDLLFAENLLAQQEKDNG